MTHPKELIIDVSVAGVSEGQSDDEKVPHAWSVGKELGEFETIRKLETWHWTNLSRYKWLRSGMETTS